MRVARATPAHLCSAPPTSPQQQTASLDALQSIFDRLDRLAGLVADVHARLSADWKPYYTVGDFAAAAGRSAYTVRRWVAEGKVNAVRVDGTGPRGRVLVPRDQLTRIVEAGAGGAVRHDLLPGPAACPGDRSP